MSSKPSFLDRLAIHMSSSELNTVISKLQSAYDATQNEQVFSVLQLFKTKQTTIRDNEVIWAQEDLQEIIDNPHLYSHSVITWATGYRDNELSS